MTASAVRPARRPVATTEQRSAYTLAPHSERNPFVTLRKITEGRSARSLALLVGTQVAALDIGGLEVQQAIQLAVKAAPMRCDRAVGEIGPAVPDRAGILQEHLELGCEDRVAVIDRILRITDQMGEAEQVRLGVCALRRQAIRQPHLRPHAGEKVRRHALAARRRDRKSTRLNSSHRSLSRMPSSA